MELSIEDLGRAAEHGGAATGGLRLAGEADLPKLKKMAGAVHTATRFGVDPRLRAGAAALYERWIERDLLAGGLALVALAHDDIIGYLTASIAAETGSISLVGVDEHARGLGAGHRLAPQPHEDVDAAGGAGETWMELAGKHVAFGGDGFGQ